MTFASDYATSLPFVSADVFAIEMQDATLADYEGGIVYVRDGRVVGGITVNATNGEVSFWIGDGGVDILEVTPPHDGLKFSFDYAWYEGAAWQTTYEDDLATIARKYAVLCKACPDMLLGAIVLTRTGMIIHPAAIEIADRQQGESA